MNRKVLVITVALMAVAMLATPLISSVQAEKTVIPFSYTGGTKLLEDVPGPEKWIQDNTARISRGHWRHFSYNGLLGTGFMDMETIISITHFDDVEHTKGQGHGNYRYIFTITSGPYGAGTLEGVFVFEFDTDSQRTPKYMQWGNATFHGTGDLKGVKMVCTLTTSATGQFWYTGELILP